MISLSRKLGLLLAVAVICSTMTAFANQVVTLTFLGDGGTHYAETGPGSAYGTENTFPYYFSISGGSPTALVCDDLLNNINPPVTWQATVYNLGDIVQNGLPAGPPPLYFASGGVMLYEELGYLTQQLYLSGTTSADQAYINWAIWDFTLGITPTDPNVLPYYDAALNNYKNGDYSNVLIYTPNSGSVPKNGPQEFLGVPEAHTSSLVAAGLLGLVALML